MMQEIVFTSARRGLRSGSTGFCTVRSTRGMPGNLAQLLERLTGYAHIFDAYGSEASWNPVNYAHYVARLGGQRFHILARISNAPLDHTNRSNKLAHLLTTDSAALAVELSEGPASESLHMPWVKAWPSDSEPTVLSDDRQVVLPMAAQVRTGVCEAWKDATGDAGWAAVLASYAADSQTPLQIILPRDVGTRSEHWTLQLVNEALSLLPPESRWDVSYSTFFTGNLPVSISCQWQFVLDGTDLAKKARLDPRSRTIDLPAIHEKKLTAPQNDLTVFAQTGCRPWTQEPESVLLARRKKRELERTPFGPAIPHQNENADFDPADDADDADEYSESLIEQPGAGSEGSTSSGNVLPRRPVIREVSRATRNRPTPLLLRPGILLLIAALGITVVVLLLSSMQKPKTTDGTAMVKAAAAEKAEKRRRDREEREARRRQLDEQLAAELLQKRTENSVVQMPSEVVQPEAVSTDSASISAAEKPSGENSRPEQPQLSPLQEIRDKGRKLELRLPSSGLQSGNDGPIRLAKIQVNSLDHVTLKRIIGGHSVLKSGYEYAIVQQPNTDQPFRDWEVTRQPVAGGGLDTKKDVVGVFRLNQKFELSFRWDKSNTGFELINCLLEIEAGDPDQKTETEKCVLREVEHISPIHFDLAKAERSERLMPRTLITDLHALELSCDYVNLPENTTRQGEAVLKAGDSTKFIVQSPGTGKYARRVTMIVTLVETDLDVQVRIRALVAVPEFNVKDKRFELQDFDWKPGLANRINQDHETFGNKVNKLREELKDRETKLEMARGSLDDKKLKELEESVKGFRRQVNEQSDEHVELKAHFHELQQLMVKIAESGQLKCSLKLKVPDSEPEGIELLVTDGPDTAQKE